MWVDLQDSESEAIEVAASVIRKGGVVLYPSDTVYGLGCDPFCQRAVERIFQIKLRPPAKGLLVLVPGLSWLGRLACDLDSDLVSAVSSRFWPGPLTMVLKARSELSRTLTGREGKIGIRWPDSPFLQSWMGRIPGPLVSTSANLSGRELMTSVRELKRVFGPQVDLFLHSSGPMSEAASTVLDLTCLPPRVLRGGVLGQKVADFLIDRFGPPAES